MAAGKGEFGKLGGADKVKAGVEGADVEELARQSGLEQSVIDQVVTALAEAQNLVILVGREGLENAGANAPALVDALVALLVATGKAGQVNSGLLALYPHNNSQGAADMGCLPNYAAGYEAVRNPGPTMDEILSGKAGLKAAYIVGSNPAAERPDCRAVLKNLEFVVVQELFMTETAKLADVVLPAASFAERDGTFTNLERRVQRYIKALEPIGESRPDWQIFTRLAEKLNAGWDNYYIAHDVANEIAKKVKPYKGFSYDKLRGEPVGWATTAGGHHVYTGTSVQNTWYGLQWETEAEARRPKYDLRWHDLQPIAASQVGGYKLIRRRVQYDNGTLIRHSDLFKGRRAYATVTLNPQDAEAMGVAAGDRVELKGSGASAFGIAVIDPRLPQGYIAAPVQIEGYPVATLPPVVTLTKIGQLLPA